MYLRGKVRLNLPTYSYEWNSQYRPILNRFLRYNEKKPTYASQRRTLSTNALHSPKKSTILLLEKVFLRCNMHDSLLLSHQRYKHGLGTTNGQIPVFYLQTAGKSCPKRPNHFNMVVSSVFYDAHGIFLSTVLYRLCVDIRRCLTCNGKTCCFTKGMEMSKVNVNDG